MKPLPDKFPDLFLKNNTCAKHRPKNFMYFCKYVLFRNITYTFVKFFDLKSDIKTELLESPKFCLHSQSYSSTNIFLLSDNLTLVQEQLKQRIKVWSKIHTINYSKLTVSQWHICCMRTGPKIAVHGQIKEHILSVHIPSHYSTKLRTVLSRSFLCQTLGFDQDSLLCCWWPCGSNLYE